MERRLLQLFQQQVLLQCEFIILAANDGDAALKRADVKGVFFAIQNFLNAAANVSKALWGQSRRFSEQRRELRESIGVADDSPLVGVTMRNNFEHFDEKIDKWWKESASKNYVDLNVGPPGFIGGVAATDMFRNYYPSTGVLTFWGQEFRLGEILSEVQRILPKLSEEANRVHWEK